MKEESKFSKYLTLFALGVAGGCIYILPYIKYTFYDAQIAAMNITNAQSGMLLTVYTILNIVLYIPGGILADKLPPKPVLIVSCIGAGLTGFLYAFTMSYVMGLVCWGLLAFTTAFVFWSSLMKAVRLVGTEKEQGFMYGFYFACNGLMKALVAFICLRAYNAKGDDIAAGFHSVVNTWGIVMFVAAALIAVIMKNKKGEESSAENKFQWSQVGTLLKMPALWIASIVIFCGYGLYSCSSYFTPYLTNVVGLDTSTSAFVAIFRNYGFLLLSPLGGLLADKVFKSTARWLTWSLAITGLLYVGVLLLPKTVSAGGAIAYTMFPAALGVVLYGTVFSILSGAGIPREGSGTAIGIASIIGYLPDMFYSTMFGTWLDKFGDAKGYPMIFIFLASTAVVGAILAYVLYRKNKKAALPAGQA
jgi:nitrate/nitrite transporter NarK